MSIGRAFVDFFRGPNVPPQGVVVQRKPNPNSGLITAGWLILLAGAFIWPILIVAFILGVILAAKGSVGHGVAIMLLTFVAPFLGIAALLA